MDDLPLIPTEALLDELQRRFESIVFMGNADHSDTEDSTTYRYAGNYITNLGAISRLTYRIQREMDEIGREADPNA